MYLMKQQAQRWASEIYISIAAPEKTAVQKEDEEVFAVLIYQESQRRKREAAPHSRARALSVI